MDDSRRGERIPEFDGVRGIAVLSVMAFHFYLRTGTPLDGVLSLGRAAVDLFFVLSGYLITGIVLGSSMDLRFLAAFHARRALRIWPVYYLTVLGLFALSRSPIGALFLTPFPRSALWFYLTFTQETPFYYRAGASQGYGPLGHFWSLAVEEQFYLFWPALAVLVGRKGIMPCAVLLAAVAVAARHRFYNSHLIISRCDGFSLGALVAVCLDRSGSDGRRASLARRFGLILAASLLGLAAGVAAFGRRLIESHAVLLLLNPAFFGLVGLLACSSGGAWLAPLRARWLCYLGRISFGLYVYHWIVYFAVDRIAGAHATSAGYLALKVGLTGTAASLSWELLESPILALKSRVSYGARRDGGGE